MEAGAASCVWQALALSWAASHLGEKTHCAIDVLKLFEYCAFMAKKKNSRKTERNAFLGNLDRLGGKKLMQHGADESSRGKESRKHSVGGGRRKSRSSCLLRPRGCFYQD